MSKALVLIDFEKEWVDYGSEYFVGDISDVIKKVNRLIGFCRKNNYKIIFTSHIEKGSNGVFAENSNNIKIINGIEKLASDALIEKYKISPFYETSMEKELKDIDEVVVCGILTNLCVRSFIEGAYDRDFKIKVIRDCCVSFDNETQDFTFRDLKNTREEIDFLD